MEFVARLRPEKADEQALLLDAAFMDDIDLCQSLYSHGADINHSYHSTRFYWYCTNPWGSHRYEATNNVKTHEGDTLLHIAVKCEHIRLLSWLLSCSSINLRKKNEFGFTANDLACHLGADGIADFPRYVASANRNQVSDDKKKVSGDRIPMSNVPISGSKGNVHFDFSMAEPDFCQVSMCGILSLVRHKSGIKYTH
mmetsp:Transcript_4012/g.5967  ORF Transcript_4012/g.5967 Transcript_4012/m.5967 type:complete len:197 (+) Transcript_4012:1-591(+)